MSFAVRLLLLCVCLRLWANPFEIDFPVKKDLSIEDYVEVQGKLRQLNVVDMLNQIYPFDIKEYNFINFYQDFVGRCSKGVSQTLIDPGRGLLPICELVKIGQGGDCCVVCCAPFDGLRSELILNIADGLRLSGFHGFFYYRIGGFPNPTGEEIRYAGVPYCFKIFMMREAQALGFNKVLWVDSSIIPLRNPMPLFEWIDQSGALINGWDALPYMWENLIPFTHQLLIELTGTDVLVSPYVNTIVFGLKMDSVSAFIEEYYAMVRLGYPFCTCFPEEFVLSALIRGFKGSPWQLQPFNVVNIAIPDDPEHILQMKKEGYFFYNRKH